MYLSNKTLRNNTKALVTITAVIFLLTTDNVLAHDIYKGEQFEATIGATLYGGVQYGDNINYGAGAFDGTAEQDRTNLEFAVEPEINLSWDLGGSSLYGALSMIGAEENGDGELSGQFGTDGDQEVDTEQFHVGWRNELLDFSVGAQDFVVGDGFIIGDGNFDTGGEDGQYWIAPHLAWSNSAIFRMNTDPIRADVFWLRADVDFGDPEMAGVNVEYSLPEEIGTIGGMYFEIIEDNGDAGLDGMEVFDLRANAIKVPMIPQLTLHGEYIHQGGQSDLTGIDRDADAWYVEGGYELSSLPWAPVVSYRYSEYSGNDPTSTSGDNTEYLGLFYKVGRDFDTWYQGEVAGEYHLFNRNQITHLAKIKAYPTEQWAVAAIYFNHSLDEKQYFGTPVTDTSWSDEINFTVEYYPTDTFYVFAALAWSSPNDAAEQALGGTDDSWVAEVYISYSFD